MLRVHFLSAALLALLGITPQARADSRPFTAKELAQGYRDGVVLAKPRPELMPTIDGVERSEGLVLAARYPRFGQIGVLKLAAGESVTAAIRRLEATGRYLYVDRDVIRHVTAVPNDPGFVNQWGLSNTGANAGGGGIPGDDIHAEAAWGVLTSASGVIVGILDSGALLTHEDLMANLWINPNPGTTASYSNGFGLNVNETDALNGLNAVNSAGNPNDDEGHGSHVSGIVGAVGDNGVGVSGVAWSVQLMELKFIDSTGNGSTTNELPCIEYAITHKVKVINASFGSTTPNQPEMDAIQAAGKAGIIFVCAAGNADEDADITNFFPADYPLDNIICVGASDNRDLQAIFSNYGSGSVDLFAPGQEIYSTWNSSTSAYQYLDGTSMAAPFVTGTVALLRAQNPNDTYRQIINRVLNGVDKKASLAGKCQTGGRLNLAGSLAAAKTAPNALFANRTQLVGLDPYTRSNNVDTPATPEAGTPAIPGGPGGNSLWWTWTAPENASVEIDTSGTKGGQDLKGGSTYPTLLGVYTGASLGSLSAVGTQVTGLTEPLEGGGGSVSYSEVKFEAVAGTIYQINVEGQNGAAGQTILAINTVPDNVSISQPRVLTGRSASLRDANVNSSRQAGEPDIEGNPGGHPLWYSWTAPYTGTAQVSAYSYDFVNDIAVYTGTGLSDLTQVGAPGVAGQLFGTAIPAADATATFTATSGTTYLIQVDGRGSTDIGDFIVNLDDSVWQGTTHDSVTCSPAIGPDGTIYVGSNDDTFYAFSPSGALKWSRSGAAPFDTSSAAVGTDGTVYASCEDGNLYAYNGQNGNVVWAFAFPSGQIPGSSASLGSDGTLYVHGTDGTNGDLYAVSSSGTQKWAFSAAGQSYAAPSLGSDGTIYLGTDEGHFYAVNPDGSQKWVFATPVAGESIYTAAAIDAQGNLYFGTLAGNFYSLTPAGALRWSYAIGNNITSAPAIANGAVYFGGYDGYLYSLTTSGSLKWRYFLGTQVRASGPAVDADGVIYIGCYDHNLYAVSASGALVRTYAAADIMRSSPVLAGQKLYFGSNDHKVYAFSLPAGLAASDWPMYQHDPQRTGRVGTGTLEISTQPSSQAVAIGSPFTLTVGASGPVSLTYQWNLNGTPISGANSASYSVASATTANAGTYTVTVTAGAANVTSAAATVTVSAGTAGHLVNLSARASVGAGSNILIAGFVIGGSGSKTMLLRGIGPTLAEAPFNVSGALLQPQLTLVNTTNGSTIFSGTAWGGGAALSTAFTQTGAFALPAGSVDAAVLETLPAGSYTSEVAGVGGTTGVALAEIYDSQPNSTAANLLNISARAAVGTGANVLIAGFVIEGSLPAQVLLRGIGPTLGTAPFNISGVLAQPQIQLFNSSGAVVQSNSGWGGTTALQNAFSQVGAFALPAGSADAAMLATLPAGSYTLQLSGVNGTSGLGLIEVYLVP